MRSRHPSPAAHKAALRAELRAARLAYAAGLAPAERAALEAALGERLAAHLPEGSIAAAYVPVRGEIDPRGAAPAPALPWFESAAGPMRFRLGPPAAPGPFGIAQPADDAPLAEPAVVIAPLLAATAEGLRLGQGGGHYDRYLAARAAAGSKPLVIGAAWDMQIVETLPAEAWDMPLDLVVTPTRSIQCRR